MSQRCSLLLAAWPGRMDWWLVLWPNRKELLLADLFGQMESRQVLLELDRKGLLQAVRAVQMQVLLAVSFGQMELFPAVVKFDRRHLSLVVKAAQMQWLQAGTPGQKRWMQVETLGQKLVDQMLASVLRETKLGRKQSGLLRLVQMVFRTESRHQGWRFDQSRRQQASAGRSQSWNHLPARRGLPAEAYYLVCSPRENHDYSSGQS